MLLFLGWEDGSISKVKYQLSFHFKENKNFFESNILLNHVDNEKRIFSFFAGVVMGM